MYQQLENTASAIGTTENGNLLGLFKYHCHYLFKKQYSKNDKAIELKSDEKDYSNVDFGENVGDRISSEDLKFKNDYKKNVLPKHKGYQKFLKNTLSITLDVSPLGVVKGVTEAILVH